MATYRDRREARANRLDGWADKRDARATEGFEKAHALADMIPFGQPILVGHHSERRHRNHIDRINSTGDRALEDYHKGKEMHSKAANIRAAADHAIYSDDTDAIQRLEARIAEWEAERSRIKAYNAACKKAGKCTAEALAMLDDRQRASIASIAKVCSYQLGPQGQFPSYATGNIGGRISPARKRLAELKAAQCSNP